MPADTTNPEVFYLPGVSERWLQHFFSCALRNGIPFPFLSIAAPSAKWSFSFRPVRTISLTGIPQV